MHYECYPGIILPGASRLARFQIELSKKVKQRLVFVWGFDNRESEGVGYVNIAS